MGRCPLNLYLRSPIFLDTFLCDLHIAAAPLVIAEDGTHFPLGHLKQTAAGALADLLEVGPQGILVQRSPVGHKFRSGLAVVHHIAAS